MKSSKSSDNNTSTPHRVLFAWIGRNDINAARQDTFVNEENDMGPIARSVDSGKYDCLVLLDDSKKSDGQIYEDGLKNRLIAKNIKTQLIRKQYRLTSPTNVEEIYNAVKHELDDYKNNIHSMSDLTFLLSSGTGAMQAVWMFLSTEYNAELLESSREQGLKEMTLPFFIKLKYPSYNEAALKEQFFTPPEIQRSFEEAVIHKSPLMKKVADTAYIAAKMDLQTIIFGETGTGKGMVVEWIHSHSHRKNKNCVTVNCGGIDTLLFNSELFGYEPNAFTGASPKGKKGKIEIAGEGTLFLDEIGELPADQQVRLLRVLQEKVFQKVGGNEDIPVKCSIIAATHRDLMTEVHEGRFREDLYYRLTEHIINIPSLRERGANDIELLAKHALDDFCKNYSQDDNENRPKNKDDIDDEAVAVLSAHRWSGNVRELISTVKRAAVQAVLKRHSSITKEDVQDCLISSPNKQDNILNRPFTENFNLDELIAELEKTYLQRALEDNNGNRTKAAGILYGHTHHKKVTDKLKTLEKKYPELSTYLND